MCDGNLEANFPSPSYQILQAEGPRDSEDSEEECRALICRENILIGYYHYVNDDYTV